MRVQLAILLGFSMALPVRGNVVELPPPVIHALTPIDSVPSTAQLDDVFNGSAQALASLQSIALATGPIDLGVQLRAIRALARYCGSPCGASAPAHATLAAVATSPRYRDARSGSDVLVLRAAIESLGVLRVPSDVDILIPQLGHPSRDIRAAVAHALRDLGNTQANGPLNVRYQLEPDDRAHAQVRLAISDALRVLRQPL
jgi:HEAT repeat protein